MPPVESKRVDDGYLRTVNKVLLTILVSAVVSGVVALPGLITDISANTAYRENNGSINDLSIKMKAVLDEHYMTRENVENAIRSARLELLADQQRMIMPLDKKLNSLDDKIDYLVKREIAKGDKK